MKQTSMQVLIALLLMIIPFSAISETIVDLPIDFSGGMVPLEKYEPGKMTYDDPSIHVERSYGENKEFDCTFYRVDITIANASQLRTESAAGGENGFRSRQKVPVAVMSRRTNAVVCMNGDYYADHAGSLVLRQGVMFREVAETLHDLLLIDEDGDFHVILAGNRDVEENSGGKQPATPVTHQELTEVNGKTILQGFEFGPCIILNGEIVETHPKSIVQPQKSQSWNRAQRICLCQVGPLQYRIVACADFGLSVQDFTQMVYKMGGVQTAYMFDGGLSAQIIFLNTKVNQTKDKNPRPVSDSIYFASAYQK